MFLTTLLNPNNVKTVRWTPFLVYSNFEWSELLNVDAYVCLMFGPHSVFIHLYIIRIIVQLYSNQITPAAHLIPIYACIMYTGIIRLSLCVYLVLFLPCSSSYVCDFSYAFRLKWDGFIWMHIRRNHKNPFRHHLIVHFDFFFFFGLITIFTCVCNMQQFRDSRWNNKMCLLLNVWDRINELFAAHFTIRNRIVLIELPNWISFF